MGGISSAHLQEREVGSGCPMVTLRCAILIIMHITAIKMKSWRYYETVHFALYWICLIFALHCMGNAVASSFASLIIAHSQMCRLLLKQCW